MASSSSQLGAGLSEIGPSIGFEPPVSPLPLRDYLSSLRLVRAYGDTWLLPSTDP